MKGSKFHRWFLYGAIFGYALLAHGQTFSEPEGRAVAMALYAQGRYAEAALAFEQLASRAESELGADHVFTLASRNNLANSLTACNRPAEAAAIHRQVLAARERLLGREHEDTVSSRNNLATCLQAQGKNAEATQEHRAVLAVRERQLGASHPDVFKSCFALALCLEEQGKLPEALAFAARAERGWSVAWGPGHAAACRAKTLRDRIQAELNRQQP